MKKTGYIFRRRMSAGRQNQKVVGHIDCVVLFDDGYRTALSIYTNRLAFLKADSDVEAFFPQIERNVLGSNRSNPTSTLKCILKRSNAF